MAVQGYCLPLTLLFSASFSIWERESWDVLSLRLFSNADKRLAMEAMRSPSSIPCLFLSSLGFPPLARWFA